jgi:hypothetical protein
LALKQIAAGNDTLKDLLGNSKKCANSFTGMVEKFAVATKGIFHPPANFKADKIRPEDPSVRAYEKAKEKNGHLYIKDMVRVSVSYAGCSAMSIALDKIPDFFTAVEAKDHYTAPKPGGYVDYNIIVVAPDGSKHLCELQLHFKTLLDAKHKGGHAAYKDEREATEGVRIRDMPDKVARGHAMRAIHKGQYAYRNARVGLSSQKQKEVLMKESFKSLASIAAQNAMLFK